MASLKCMYCNGYCNDGNTAGEKLSLITYSSEHDYEHYYPAAVAIQIMTTM